jgi:hypothetical protein
MQTPTIGRIVLHTYHPSTDDTKIVVPAMITKVYRFDEGPYADDSANALAVALTVFPPDAQPYAEHAAFHADVAGEFAGSWSWPPRS